MWFLEMPYFEFTLVFELQFRFSDVIENFPHGMFLQIIARFSWNKHFKFYVSGCARISIHWWETNIL